MEDAEVTQLDPGRLWLLDRLDLRLHSLGDDPGVLAFPHEHDPLHEIVLVVAPEHPEPDRMADVDRPDIPDPDGCALLGGHHDILHVTGGLDEADAAHRHSGLASLHEAAAGVRAVVRATVEHLLQGQGVGPKPNGIDVDLILLGATAP